jgi:hypothetical protein
MTDRLEIVSKYRAPLATGPAGHANDSILTRWDLLNAPPLSREERGKPGHCPTVCGAEIKLITRVRLGAVPAGRDRNGVLSPVERKLGGIDNVKRRETNRVTVAEKSVLQNAGSQVREGYGRLNVILHVKIGYVFPDPPLS